ncbi:MAG: hypothetical protein IPJ71_17410 [Bdellovibrionales bacterium]|nr:hypothetical protein [Bdellovibrionales bacterium]
MTKKIALVILLLSLNGQAGAKAPAASPKAGGSKASAGKYSLGAEVQIGYPFMNLKNPDGEKAYYDGVGMRLNVNIPILDLVDTDVYLVAGVKYFDLVNTANSASQYEASNLIGPGAGVSLRYTKVIIGAQYYQMWGRHFATGAFSDRVSYAFQAVDYFGGLNYQFGRLGVGLIYFTSSAVIDKSHTGLESDTSLQSSMISLQFTFNMGETLWQILGGLF